MSKTNFFQTLFILCFNSIFLPLTGYTQQSSFYSYSFKKKKVKGENFYFEVRQGKKMTDQLTILINLKVPQYSLVGLKFKNPMFEIIKTETIIAEEGNYCNLSYSFVPNYKGTYQIDFYFDNQIYNMRIYIKWRRKYPIARYGPYRRAIPDQYHSISDYFKDFSIFP